MNNREFFKNYNNLNRESRKNAKRTKCLLCGQEQTSFCNSHSMPKFILDNIDNNGNLLSARVLFGTDDGHKYTGLKNTWTFQNICRKCDAQYFADYEKEEALLSKPTDRIMAEIALKNSLFMYYKYSIDKERNKLLHGVEFVRDSLDLRDIENSIHNAKDVIDFNLRRKYKILFFKLLDWVSPVCAQTLICVENDLQNNPVNNIFDFSEAVIMQYIHLCVLPLKTQTYVLLFHNRRDKKYKDFDSQFLKLSEEKKLEYINFMIFRYIEHFAISPQVEERVLNDKKLIALTKYDIRLHRIPCLIQPNEITNLLNINLKE